jgi:O-succinylbenzoate synthase
MHLEWRPYRFALPSALVNAQGRWFERSGWLLRLEASSGRVGWGEVPDLPSSWCAPPGSSALPLAEVMEGLPQAQSRAEWEQQIQGLPVALAFGLGLALAELDGLGAAGWLSAPASAVLLPAGSAALDRVREHRPEALGTVKWKVAVEPDARERDLLRLLLQLLPAHTRLRLDANGAWDRQTAALWADQLQGEPRLEWLEQPLPPSDQEGLLALAQRLPVALDESLRAFPAADLQGWPGWQVHRPAAAADPRPLLRRLQTGEPRLMLSTAFETGIGLRFLHHLAGLQAQGPTPTAPGLAPGWSPQGPLFSSDPAHVWEAARG